MRTKRVYGVKSDFCCVAKTEFQLGYKKKEHLYKSCFEKTFKCSLMMIIVVFFHTQFVQCRNYFQNISSRSFINAVIVGKNKLIYLVNFLKLENESNSEEMNINVYKIIKLDIQVLSKKKKKKIHLSFSE